MLTKVAVEDGSGVVELTWFRPAVPQGSVPEAQRPEIVAYGTVQGAGGAWRSPLPSGRLYNEDADPLSGGRLVPVYPLTEGIFQGNLRRIIHGALDIYLPLAPDIIPEDVRDRLDLMDAAEALRNIHFPESEQALDAARKRLAFEELFLLQFALAMRETGDGGAGAGNIVHGARELLGRPETNTAVRVDGGAEAGDLEIAADMASPRCINRLLQGDVGSGKTAVLSPRCLSRCETATRLR